ncbi:MAG: class I SAM-dependent methyltransferase [Gammaproteobacteria bacterium]|nr:class I SAM-dependent methyltransferase [Gammaproteobacteria bacterium]
MVTPEQIHAGQAAFTKSTLALYDQLVLGATCRLIWRCPIERTLEFYQQQLSANHLEVGVGTGFFLDRSRFPKPTPRLALLDLNTHCLAHTAKRLTHYSPEIYQANILAPIQINMPGFDSIGLNYVLHCLPGAFPEKGIAFANLKALLNPGGVLFGSTVLHGGVSRSLSAKALMRLCNARRVFSNERDDLNGLVQALEQHLKDVRVDVVGCVAQFSGRA